MATGDVLNPKRPRYEANERFDTQDAEAQSAAPRSHLDAAARAMLSVPVAAGGAAPVGTIFTGFGLTPNPTSGSDAKVRVGSSLGVALDANGRLIIKEAGTTVDLTIPSGTYQIYAYYIEGAADLAVRRFIAVATPYAESGRSINTTLSADVAFYVRSGDATAVVSSDAVNGQTVALCLLGVATNTAGAITIVGYDATNAPNGSFVTNRLTSARKPTTSPTLNTKSGSVATIADLVSAIAYFAGLGEWGGAGSQDSLSGQLVAYTGASTSVSGTPATLNDTSQSFVVNELVGGWLKDNGGNFWPITSNTATSIVSTGAGPTWWWNVTTGSNTIPNGPPTAGAYTVYAPVAKNNYGAYSLGVSAQQVFDWLAQYRLQPHTWSQLQTFSVAPTAPDYKFTNPRVHIIPSSKAVLGGGVTNPPLQFPIELPVGAVITGYGFRVNKTSNNTFHIYGVLLQCADDSSSTVVNADGGNAVGPGGSWGIDDASNAPGVQDIHPTNVVIVSTLDVDHQYYLTVSGSDSSTPAALRDSYGSAVKRWNINTAADFVAYAYVSWKFP